MMGPLFAEVSAAIISDVIEYVIRPPRTIYVNDDTWTCMTVISMNCVYWPTDPGTNTVKHRVISGLKTGCDKSWYQSHTDRRKALVSMAVSLGTIL